MFCKYCGNSVPDGASFCPACGSSTDSEVKAPDYVLGAERTGVHELSPEEQEKKEALARKILTLGICSVAFALTVFLAFVGIILAAVCRSNINEYEKRYGSTSGMASVGKGLSIGGLVGSIFMTVIAAIYIFIFFIAFVVAFSFGSEVYGVEFASLFANTLKFF